MKAPRAFSDRPLAAQSSRAYRAPAMRARRRPHYLLPLVLLLSPMIAAASDGEHGAGPMVWLTLAAILLVAKLGGEIAVRFKQPPVLGELCAGIFLGNLGLMGFHGFEHAADLPSVSFLAELGVVLLLFEVGLESTLTEMKKVAPQSGLVAIIGVVGPMVMGFGVTSWLLPDESMPAHLFVAATLCATSVGITARVLQDLNAIDRIESKIILGAAVIDDVLGLIVLAVVASIASSGDMPDTLGLLRIVGLATGFLVGALILGAFVMPGVFRVGSRLRAPGVLPAMAVGLCLLLAGLAALSGLAAIVGAFAAGLILDEVHVRPFGKKSARDLSEYVAPIVAVLAPIFFVRTGMMVDLSGLSAEPLILAGALSAVAIVGKLVAGLGVVGGAKADRFTVGIGMIPRGEVGLIFANVGASIHVNGEAVIVPEVYMAIVLMVMVSTVVTPPWLSLRLAKLVKREAAAAELAASDPPAQESPADPPE